MLALTFSQLILWAVIIGGSLGVLLVVLVGIGVALERWGRRWTYPGVLLVAACIAAAIVFPLQHGDGRSPPYNDGWDFVATSSAGSFHDIYGSENCSALFIGGGAPQDRGVFTKIATEKAWVRGCKDAMAALSQAEQNVTIPVKFPRY